MQTEDGDSNVGGRHRKEKRKNFPMWQTIIVTATEWDNFWHLRDHPDAHPAIAKPAGMMRELYKSHKPRKVLYGNWHLPLVDFSVPEDRDSRVITGNDAMKVSVGRCARVSYLTHDGVRDPQKDIELHDDLLKSGHMSPFEHVARPVEPDDLSLPKSPAMVNWSMCTYEPSAQYAEQPELSNIWFGNLKGWVQYRKTIHGEADMLGVQ